MPQPKSDGKTLISVSYDRQFTQYQELTVPSSDVAYCRGDDCYIRIPISETDLKIIEIVDSWPQTLNSLGFEISTGPVVDFRALKHLRATIENSNCVPLLWMHNIKGIDVEWSIEKNGKAKAIEINPRIEESCRTDKKLCCFKTIYFERTEETSSRSSIECRQFL